jgi:hypothetical protein
MSGPEEGPQLGQQLRLESLVAVQIAPFGRRPSCEGDPGLLLFPCADSDAPEQLGGIESARSGVSMQARHAALVLAMALAASHAAVAADHPRFASRSTRWP